MCLDDNKNKQISASIAATRNKRLHQICRVYTVKVDYSRLSTLQKEQLKMLFVEGKRIKNDCLSWCNSNPDNKPWNYICGKAITYKDKDGNFIDYTLKYVGSQMKQSIVSDIISNIRTLSSLKKKGQKIGKLKYCSELRSINLQQYKITYQIKSNTKIKIQHVKGLITVRGLKQFINKPNIEIANAKLLNRPDGYYLAITTYIDKTFVDNKPKINETIGIDFGCQTNITLSNGEKFNVSVQETERIKKLQRKIQKQKKGSKRRFKNCIKLQKEYQHLSNIKNDKANKLVHYISRYQTVIMQDEQLCSWLKTGHGKVIQHSILGRVKAKLKTKPNVHTLSKWCPTTQLCTCCGNKIKLPLNEHTYICPECGYKEDRDIHAAKNMVWFYENKVGTEHTKLTLAGMNTSIILAIQNNM